MGFLKHFIIILLFFLFNSKFSKAQVIADAGTNQTICPGTTAKIGSSGATGGKPPYNYSWSPATGLDNPTISAPTASPIVTTTYMLIVTDDALASDTAYVTITVSALNDINAGRDTNICENTTFILGGEKNYDNNGVTYNWEPVTGLNNPASPHPIVKTNGSITYTLTATANGCPPKTDVIVITVIPTPVIDAGSDMTIKEGETITLHATGGTIYSWEPSDSLKYPHTPDPDVSPGDTTTYYVFATDPTGTCVGIDSVTVNVEKSDEIIIYNTFTPNGDGSNDVWYIANILKYPNSRLEIFNRNGRMVYKSRGYQNTWNGKSSGEELPEATYFYVLDLADGKRIYHGTVTIVR